MSPRSQIVKRLQDLIPSLGKVQGVVAWEAALQGNVKATTAFVYRIASQAASSRNSYREEQIFTDRYVVILVSKNVKDDGDEDSSDWNDEVCAAITKVLFGWTPNGCCSPMRYEKGEVTFARNMLVWHEIYAVDRLITDAFGEDLIVYIEPFTAITTFDAFNGMPIVMNPDGTISLAAFENPKVIGLISTGAPTGYVAKYQTDSALLLEDWSEVTGISTLVTGDTYYLAAEGGMTNVRPVTGMIFPLGRAISEHIFDIEISDVLIEL